MSIPYQPTFKLQPKTGFRYSSQPFVPPVQPINAPPPLGLDGSAAAAPPVMGAGQGPALLMILLVVLIIFNQIKIKQE